MMVTTVGRRVARRCRGRECSTPGWKRRIGIVLLHLCPLPSVERWPAASIPASACRSALSATAKVGVAATYSLESRLLAVFLKASLGAIASSIIAVPSMFRSLTARACKTAAHSQARRTKVAGCWNILLQTAMAVLSSLTLLDNAGSSSASWVAAEASSASSRSLRNALSAAASSGVVSESRST